MRGTLGWKSAPALSPAIGSTPSPGSFDLVVANPPYLTTAEIGRISREVRRHDPLVALDGGADGLKAYRRIAARAGEVLDPAARSSEIGATQADAVIALLRAAGLAIDAEARPMARSRGPAARCFGLCLRREAFVQLVARQKRSLENSDVRDRFASAEGTSRSVDVNKARGRLQTATRAEPLESRLKGGVPLGTFRRRSTAHLS